VNKVILWAVSILMVTLMLGLAACPHAAAGELIKSDKPRDTAPDANESEMATLVEGNSAFAFNLYHQLKEEEGNLFYSPHSISIALAMTYAGARSETEEQMAKALQFRLPQDQLHPAFNALALELDSRGEGAQGKDGEGFRLNIRVLDFIGAPEESRVTINDWVAEQTEDRIENLIPKGLINTMTRLVLTNAIYFNAAWAYPFEEDLTSDGVFHLLDGGEATVPMMHQTESFGYAEGDGYQAVELLYDGGELSMVILLPASGQFEAFEEALDVDQANAIINALGRKEVALTMPKFEFDSEFSLGETLAALGMPSAFSGDANFSGMTGNRNLYIADVVHKAFVSVDEAGTEAAAATAVVMEMSAIPETVEVTINRPFIFLIRDIETGAILFVGRILNPAA
jgi:serpin B